MSSVSLGTCCTPATMHARPQRWGLGPCGVQRRPLLVSSRHKQQGAALPTVTTTTPTTSTSCSCARAQAAVQSHTCWWLPNASTAGAPAACRLGAPALRTAAPWPATRAAPGPPATARNRPPPPAGACALCTHGACRGDDEGCSLTGERGGGRRKAACAHGMRPGRRRLRASPRGKGQQVCVWRVVGGGEGGERGRRRALGYDRQRSSNKAACLANAPRACAAGQEGTNQWQHHVILCTCPLRLQAIGGVKALLADTLCPGWADSKAGRRSIRPPPRA